MPLRWSSSPHSPDSTVIPIDVAGQVVKQNTRGVGFCVRGEGLPAMVVAKYPTPHRQRSAVRHYLGPHLHMVMMEAVTSDNVVGQAPR